MLIRSQDKKNLTNFNQVTDLGVVKLPDGFGINAYYAFSVSDDYTSMGIGEYSTEEKAIKVLDMICNFADEKHYEKIVTEKCGCISGVVFDMPQDSEV